VKYSTVICSALVLLFVFLSVFLLAACNAGEANVGIASRPLFAHAPASPIAMPGGPGNVVIGDMNKDGRADLVVAVGRSHNITVMLGQGKGRFAEVTAGRPTTPESPGEMVLGDLNGDSNLDLVYVSHDSYNATMLLGDGKGGLVLAPNSPIVMKEGKHPHTHGLALGDMNGDNKLDIVTVNNSDNDVSIAFGDGRGSFTRAPTTFAVGPSPYPLALGDVNDDHQLDIIATATATGPARAQQLPFSRALTLLLADGRSGFRPSQLPLRTGQPWFVAIGDINGDRKPDLVATHHDQSALTVMLGDGRGVFSEASESPFELGHSAWQIVLADVNHDGKPDVIAAAGDGVRVMLGDGQGGFRPAPSSPFVVGRGTWQLAVSDVNGDGKSDVVTANSESDTISILLGQ